MQSQDLSNDWTGHFSYLDVKDVSQSEDKIYAAANNAIFVYDINTHEIEKISTVNGLSGENISTIHYSSNYELLLIGYENGLMEIVLDNEDEVLTVIDILNKPTISPENKVINHFNEVDDIVYISTDYGVSVYNLNNLEFGETYFFGTGGAQLQVKQTTIYNGYIYAATYDAGIYYALVDNPNLIDYQQWQSITAATLWLGIQSIEDRLFAIRRNRRLYEIVNNSLTTSQVFQDHPTDIKRINNKLLVTTQKEAYIYDSDFNQIFNTATNSDYEPDFTSSALTSSNDVFIGTNGNLQQGKPGYGILKTSFSNPLEFEPIHPECPLLNDTFSIEAYANQVWSVYGKYASFNWTGGVPRTGISHYKGEEWINTPYDSITAVIPDSKYLSDVSVNPFNTDQVFVSSFYRGLIETIEDQPVTLHVEDNSSIVAWAADYYYLITTSKYDDNGALWVLNSRVDKALNKFENEQWTNYDLSDVVTSAGGNLGYSDIEFADQESVFVGSYAYGLVGLQINGGTVSAINKIYSEDQNMPSTYVTSLAKDNRNQLWIGTKLGLRVLYNTSSFFTDPNPTVSEIIILEDGVAEELLYQQYITAIEVDGSNNKWIATIGSGLFYFSSDGQETIHHFTKDNSPLPTNNIADLSIDPSSGILYIATEKGLLSYKAGGSIATENLENAYVYPNPVRPTFNITEEKVKIKDISDNVNIKITDIEGNLVAEAETNTNSRYKGYNLEIDGGTAFWNGKNLANNVVASGVYLVMLSDLDTFETKVLKLMVVR